MAKYLLLLAILLTGSLGLYLYIQPATQHETAQSETQTPPGQESIGQESVAQSRTPIEGAWQPDMAYFLQSLAKRGVRISPKQQKKLAHAMAKMRLIITANTLTFVYPNINGTYGYTSQPTATGCVDLTADKLGLLRLCRKQAQLVLTYPATGKTELLNRI